MASDAKPGAPLPTNPSGTESSKFQFVSYRMEIRSKEGNPPKNMRRWLLKDNQGIEHVAVDTICYLPGAKTYKYKAVEPFSLVKPLACTNITAIILYLNDFVPEAARQAVKVEPYANQPEAGPPISKTKKNKPKFPAIAPLVGAEGAPPPMVPMAVTGTSHSQAASKTKALQEAKIIGIRKDLEFLKNEYGMDYTLTLVDADRSISVVSSAPVARKSKAVLKNDAVDKKRKVLINEDTVGLADSTKKVKKAAQEPPVSNTTGDEKAVAELQQEQQKLQPEALKEVLEVDPVVVPVLEAMGKNFAPFIGGRWKTDAMACHPLQLLSSHIPAHDCGEQTDADLVVKKLECSLGGEGYEGQFLTVIGDNAPLPPALGLEDIELKSVWGLDKYTRNNVAEALKQCSELFEGISDDDEAEKSIAINAFIQRILLPALNAVGKNGWDFGAALKLLIASKTVGVKNIAAAKLLMHVIDAIETHHNKGTLPNPAQRDYFRAHPKGDGVVCIRKDGLKRGAFVGEYIGEIYPAWRWYERMQKMNQKQTATQRKASLRMGSNPTSYNFELERPKDAPGGYDVLYIDASTKGSLASRLGHSCTPNCRAVATVVEGRLTVGVWVTADILEGEELTLDYADETELEVDYRNAVCLCGSEACRGSHLIYNPPMNQATMSQCVLHRDHSLADRLHIILNAGSEPHLSFEDKEKLSKFGIGDCLLGARADNPVPHWLKKWAALILGFIEQEAELLPALLKSPPNPEDAFSDEDAVEEVNNNLSVRLKSLAVALDRAKMFLRHQPEATCDKAPLYVLSDENIVDFIWSGEDSIASRALKALNGYEQTAAKASLVANRKPRKSDIARTGSMSESNQNNDEDAHMDDADADNNNENTDKSLSDKLQEYAEALDASTAEEARQALRSMAAFLREQSKSNAHAALYDTLILYGNTTDFIGITEYDACSATLCDGDKSGPFKAQYLLATLVSWYRPESDPMTLYQSERRGVATLPEIDSSYLPTFASGKYVRSGERRDFLEHIRSRMKSPWPTGIGFGYKAYPRVLASPQLDAALHSEDRAPAVAEVFLDLLQAYNV